MDARRAPDQGRRRVPAHRDRHVSGDRPNAFFVFAGTFPTNNAIANLLLGAPVTFYQGLGDFSRGIRVRALGALRAGRVARRRRALTLNYGLRYERINPFTEVEDRLNGFMPGVQSQVRPDAPGGLLFPGDPGVGTWHRAERQRVHAAHRRGWDPDRDGQVVGAASYGIYYDQFQNGSGTASQVAISATAVGAVQPVQRRRA